MICLFLLFVSLYFVITDLFMLCEHLGYQVGVIETRRKAVKKLDQSSTNDDNELSNVVVKVCETK